MKKKTIILNLAFLSVLTVLSACEGKRTEYEASSGESTWESAESEAGEGALANPSVAASETVVEKENQEIVTTSQLQSSFRQSIGEGMDVTFLGMPRTLTAQKEANDVWTTSDETIATVQDGVVTGWKEGVVQISQMRGEETLREWEMAITTFNDGRQVEGSYEWEREELSEILMDEAGMHEPAFWRNRLNTIQDVISYFQVSGFYLNYDLPLLATVDSYWLWSVPGDMVLLENCGGSYDMADAACYLLQHDYEDQGYILVFGYGGDTYYWLYEDGYYYLVDFGEVLNDLRDGKREEYYTFYKTNDLDAFAEHVLAKVNKSETLAVLMTSALGRNFQPPVCLSYLHDSSEIYHKHVTIGMESIILDGAKVLYENPNFDFELKGIPTEEIPAGVPRYGAVTGREYEYPYSE